MFHCLPLLPAVCYPLLPAFYFVPLRSVSNLPQMEGMRNFNFLVEEAVNTQDGQKLRILLRESTEATVQAISDFYQNDQVPWPSVTQPQWKENLPIIVQKCFVTAGAIRANDWIDASDHISNALSAYMSILNEESDWSLHLFHSLCEDVRVIAQIADEQLRDDQRKPCKLETAERLLKRAFTIVNNDRGDFRQGSRRAGALGCMNQMLKIYFRLNNLGLCVNLTRMIGSPNFPDIELFPLSHRITFQFYSGRLSLYDDKYEAAVKQLEFALNNISPELRDHRRRILLFLIPAKILSGHLPTEKTLAEFSMKWFKDIVPALRSGDIGRFEIAVKRYEEFFIRSALFLSIEKMRPLVHCALVRQISKIMGTKIPLDQVILAMKMCSLDVTLDEVECILANLIHQNYIKGYIAHKAGVIVLSKKNAFPKLVTT